MPSDTNDAILSARGVRRYYQMGRARLEVLRGCSLDVRRGEFVAIMGKSGSGKSTLLHVLGALDRPQAGTLTVDGVPLIGENDAWQRVAARTDPLIRAVQRILLAVVQYLALPLAALYLVATGGLAAVEVALPSVGGALQWLLRSFAALGWFAGTAAVGIVLWTALQVLRLALVDMIDRDRIRHRRGAFGFVFQFYHLLPELSVMENVLIPRMVRASTLGWAAQRRAARADALAVLERVGLGQRLKHKPAELSGGERQRVAIARALIHKPKVLFADEPTGNLDAESGRQILDLLRELHREGQTLVMVTHDASVAACADRVLKLEGGQLVATSLDGSR